MARGEVRFYHATSAEGMAPANLTDGMTLRHWRPDQTPTPKATLGKGYIVYRLFHSLGIFANPGFGATCVDGPDGTLLHASWVFPGFFRFPFMAKPDLQIGATWTDPSARGKGLARTALAETVRHHAEPGRAFWYLTETENQASCRVAEATGFHLAGLGAKEPRLGLRALGAYRLQTQSPAPIPS